MKSFKRILFTVCITILIAFLVNEKIITSKQTIPIKYVLTGAPGAGKSSVLRYLEFYHQEQYIPEVAADYFALKSAQGIDARENPRRQEEILHHQVFRERSIKKNSKNRIFLDRSIIDNLAYIDFCDLEPIPGFRKHIQSMQADESYSKTVFFIENLGLEHYKKSAVRSEGYKEALEIEEKLKQTYIENGFTLVRIPPASVGNRAEIILDYLDNQPVIHKRLPTELRL